MSIYESVIRNLSPFLGGVLLLAAVGWVSYLKNKHDQTRDSERKCKACLKGILVRRYEIVQLAPERGSLLQSIITSRDYLCQIQGVCNNPGCSHKCKKAEKGLKIGDNMPIVEKTYVKHWWLKNTIFRFRQLQHTVPISELFDHVDLTFILKERTPLRRPKPSLEDKGIRKPLLGRVDTKDMDPTGSSVGYPSHPHIKN